MRKYQHVESYEPIDEDDLDTVNETLDKHGKKAVSQLTPNERAKLAHRLSKNVSKKDST